MRGMVDECPRCGAKDVYMDEVYDARNIYCGSACDNCVKSLTNQFRPEIFCDPSYFTDEPIDED